MLTKLVTASLTSKYGNALWKVGETVSIPIVDRSNSICGPGLLHVYEGSPELAVLLDPIHAGLGPTARCLEVEGEVVVRDGALKAAAYELKVVRELPLPAVSNAIATKFAIYCAQAVIKKGSIPIWEKWATNWLSGKDRASETAWGAARAADEAAEEAWATAAGVGAGAAEEAAEEAARVAARAGVGAGAARAAAKAARVADEAAWGAADEAARVAARAAGVVELDLNVLALRAFNAR